MKKFLPLFILLAVLILTVAGTVVTAVSYPRKKKQAEKTGYDLVRSSTRQLYHQVFLFIRAKKYREAENLLLRINRRLPGDSSAFRILGKLYYLRGDDKAAAEIFYKLAVSEPHDPVLRNNLAVLLARRGLYNTASRLLLEAEMYSNGAKYIQFNLFYICILKKNFKQAAKYLQAVQRETDDPRISFIPAEAIIFSPLDSKTAGGVERKK